MAAPFGDFPSSLSVHAVQLLSLARKRRSRDGFSRGHPRGDSFSHVRQIIAVGPALHAQDARAVGVTHQLNVRAAAVVHGVGPESEQRATDERLPLPPLFLASRPRCDDLVEVGPMRELRPLPEFLE